MRIWIIVIALLIISFSKQELLAQDTASASTGKNIYRKAWHAGFLIHTRGIGGHYRGEVFRGSMLKNFYSIEGYNIKHPKEQKSFNAAGDQTNSFIYGKLNSVYVLKGGVGQQRIMFEKLVIRGVQISTVYGISFDLAVVKPVYLEVLVDEKDGQVPSTERYHPGNHPYERILGRGPFLKGFGESRIIPGVGAKAALNFEFAPADELIKAIEIGVNTDFFHDPLPLMAHNTQYNVHLNLYVNFQFGRKSYL